MSNLIMAGILLGCTIGTALFHALLDEHRTNKRIAALRASIWQGRFRVVKRHRTDGKFWWAVEEEGIFGGWLLEGHYADEAAATARAQELFDAYVIRTEQVKP